MNERTKSIYRRMVRFGAKSVEIADGLPDTPGCRNVARQLSRSGTVVGANYREAQRARWRTLGEADETLHWVTSVRSAKSKR